MNNAIVCDKFEFQFWRFSDSMEGIVKEHRYAKERDDSIKNHYGAVKRKEKDNGVALQGNPM